MNNKLIFFLKRYVLKVANISGGYDSSAQILESDLAKLGIRLPKKLYFQYKLPGGMSSEKYEREMAKAQIVCLLWPIKRQIQDGFLDGKDLTDEEIEIMQNYLNSLEPKYLKILDKHVVWVKQNNPELSKINVPDSVVQKVGFLNGVLYGFGSEEIAYFINRTREEMERDHKEGMELDNILNRIGVRLWYILCPDNRLMLLEEIEKYLIRKEQSKVKD